ncbi:MAG: lipoprotein [Betaproteobacteria bacterium]|nr:lipoprotein [Betaproteobacteria bacterium]MDH4322731.1 lipoprotein [Betaproteobacteria bacterium]MDH5211266.1 lipoprotein [Betaproteobacteria bacterium]MDH5577512.1 lipoprotein [Betaproteobacteria bacterium]
MRSLVLVAAAVLLAAACGQRGPLYLRDKPPPSINPPKAEPYQPVPYPADAERVPEKK